MDSGDRAILLDAGLEFHQDGTATTVTIENFFACEADVDRRSEDECGVGDNNFMIKWIVITAKAAAVGSGDHANVGGEHFQYFGKRAMKIMRGLRAGPNRQLSIGILDRDGSVLLDRKMRVSLKEKCVFKNFIGLGKAFFHVAKLQRHEFMNVSFFAVSVNPRLGACEAFLWTGARLHDFIVEIDQVQPTKG